MKIEDILSRFDGVEQKSPDNWMARCPAHGDNNPSLSITLKSDGKVLMHCFSGCTVEEICQAVGMKMSDLMPETVPPVRLPERKKKNNLGKWICDYVYQDEDGAGLYKIARYEKEGSKTFVHLRPDTESRFGWTFGIHDKKSGELMIKYRCPFRLPRIVEAAKSGKTIFVLEGEKDVLNFEAATGCAATCNSGGALKWGQDFPADWIKWFSGAKGIVIIADNDLVFKTVVTKYRGKVTSKDMPHWKGQKHAVDVKMKFIKAGFPADRIKLMVMPGVGDAKVKDFSDWVAVRKAGGFAVDRAAFQEAYKAAAAWPDEWNFSADELSRAFVDFASVEKSGRRASALGISQGEISAASPQEKSGDAQAISDIGDVNGTGRFGVLLPQSPTDGHKVFRVSLHVFKDKFVNIDVSDKECDDDLPLVIAKNCAIVGAMFKHYDLKFSAQAKNEVTADVCMMWLRARGKFFWNADDQRYEESMYFDSRKKELMYLNRPEFQSYFATVSKINRETATFKYAMSMINDGALDRMGEGVSSGVLPSRGWEFVPSTNTSYVSCGDGEMYRIAPGKIEKVPNGTDGVVFLRGATLRPWVLKDGDGIDPFRDAAAFKGANFADSNSVMIVRLWFLNIFRKHTTKPPLLITGKERSGKTRMAKAILEVLGVKPTVYLVEDGDKGKEAFWIKMDTSAIVVYDNFDSKIEWASESLELAASNGTQPKRILYTTGQTADLHANSQLIITSNNPQFAEKSSLADRLQTTHLLKRMGDTADEELTAEINQKRDEYLTWAARLLSKALANDISSNEILNKRHSSYSKFSIELGRVGGFLYDVRRALGAAEKEKSLLPLQQDRIASLILHILLDKNGEWLFSSQEMSDALIAYETSQGMADSKTSEYLSVRRIGKTLSKYFDQFGEIFKIDREKIITGKKYYSFKGLKPGAENLGELVSIKHGFGETPIKQEYSKDFLNTTSFNSLTHQNINMINENECGGLDDDGFNF